MNLNGKFFAGIGKEDGEWDVMFRCDTLADCIENLINCVQEGTSESIEDFNLVSFESEGDLTQSVVMMNMLKR